MDNTDPQGSGVLYRKLLQEAADELNQDVGLELTPGVTVGRKSSLTQFPGLGDLVGSLCMISV